MKKKKLFDIHSAERIQMERAGRKSIKEIFVNYYPRLAFFAESLLHDKQEAEDIASAALGKLWENMSGGKGSDIKDVQAWLFVIVRNTCYNYLKRQQVKKRNDGEIGDWTKIDQDIEANLIKEDIINKLFLEINQLPLRCKQVAQLIYIQGYTPAEVSEKLGISPSTVRSQQARAIELIRTALLKKNIFMDSAILIFFLFSLDK